MPESHDAQRPPMQDGNNAHTRKSRRRLWLMRGVTFLLPLLVIGGAIGGTIAMSAMAPEPEEKEEVVKALPVLTAIAVSGEVTLKVNAQGEVQPRTEINIVPQVSGRITYMSPVFIEGGKFRKDDLLVRVEPEEFRLRVVQFQANVAQAETALLREESEARIAREDFAEIGGSEAATPLTLREPQVAEAKANLESAKARLAEAELQFKRTSIYAPFTGRVAMRHIDSGEFVTTGTKLGQIYADGIMDVRLPLTNDELRRAGLTLGYEAGREGGIPVTLTADVAGKFGEWTGQIVRTDSRFDPETRVLFAYVEVRNPFSAKNIAPLAPGLFVDAAISGQTVDNIIIIPRTGLRGQNQVYIANSDDTLSIKTVSVLSSNRDDAMISSGLSAGDVIVTSPIRGVAEGMSIDPVTGDSLNESSLTGEQP